MSSEVFEVEMFINTIWELAVKSNHEGKKNPSCLSSLQSPSVSQLQDFRDGGGGGSSVQKTFQRWNLTQE